MIAHPKESLTSNNPDSHFPLGKQRTKQFCFFKKRQSHSKRFPEGHFAKDYPVKPHKAIKLIQHLESTIEFSPTTDQIEHLFSEQDEPNDDTVFALLADSNNSDSDSNNSEFEPIYTVQPSSILIYDRSIPIPSVKI